MEIHHWLDMNPSNMRVSPRSGCDGLGEREKTEHLLFRYRPRKRTGNGVSPRSWSSSPTGIVTKPGESLSLVTFPLNPGCMPLVRGTKIKAGHRQPEKPNVPAVLRQGVGARKKDMPALGYYVADALTAHVRSSFVSDGTAVGSALLCTSSA